MLQTLWDTQGSGLVHSLGETSAQVRVRGVFVFLFFKLEGSPSGALQEC